MASHLTSTYIVIKINFDLRIPRPTVRYFQSLPLTWKACTSASRELPFSLQNPITISINSSSSSYSICISRGGGSGDVVECLPSVGLLGEVLLRNGRRGVREAEQLLSGESSAESGSWILCYFGLRSFLCCLHFLPGMLAFTSWLCFKVCLVAG